MVDRTLRAWLALYRRLESRSLELREEVNNYPTPIARCDLQLPHAIEQRDAAIRQLRRAQHLQQLRTTATGIAWREQLHEFAREISSEADQELSAACHQLLDSLRA